MGMSQKLQFLRRSFVYWHGFQACGVKPNFPESPFRGFIQITPVCATGSALAGGAALGFEFAGMLEIVEAPTLNDFYKSMTTYADHQVWQDVYRPCTEAGEDL
jgi:hypothetical protein